MTWNCLLLSGSIVLSLSLTGCDPSQNQGTSVGQKPQATAPALQAAAATQAAVFAKPQALTVEQRRVRLLIEQVEQAYARGEADYRKGKLPEAKVEFDRAVDLMLLSGIDIRSDSALQAEFDHIVDQVNALEMESLKLGNGFVPKEEPTPAEVASGVTFEVDPKIVAKAKAELATTKSDLPLVVNDYVAVYINFFANTQKGHNTLLHSLQRGGRYKQMIQRVMAEEGVPQDLIYLAVAESGFNPRALNRGSGAGGMWQFMPHDKFYGLASNAYVDERFDPEKSTRAYARYMKFIYNQLGDWYLSMAAYDWGTGRVQQAVQKTGYADYWELYRRNNLPAETKVYVPEILAAIIIANHPTQYGFDDITLDPPVLTDTVTINYSVDLRLVSDLVGAPLDELQALNPSLLRRVTPPDTSFDLHLPAGTATLFDQRIALVPEARRNAWRYHRVAKEDTLASVAHEFHVQVDDLAAANQLHESDSLKGVEALAIPAAPAVTASSSTVQQMTRLYKVRKGDTLITIADRFGVSLSQLRSWNKISGIKVAAGRRLQVAEPAVAHSSSRSRRHRAAASETESDTTAKTKGTTKGAHTKKGSARTSDEQATDKQGKSSHGKSSHAKAAAKSSHAEAAEKPSHAKSAEKSSRAKSTEKSTRTKRSRHK